MPLFFVQDHSAISFTLQELTGLSAAGKVQNADVLIHQKDIGWNVRFPSSASPLHYLISKQYIKKIGPCLYNETDLVRAKDLSPMKLPSLEPDGNATWGT